MLWTVIKRWDRIEVGLNGLCIGDGEESSDPVKTIKERYEKGENDEFLKPIIVGGKEARIQDNDQVFFFNYRSDRVREITQLLGDVDRSPKTRLRLPKEHHSHYYDPHMGNVLAETLGAQGINQVHVAETEKYAHVTFFFNGGVEKVFPLEVRDESQDLVPSNKSVATYDKAPEMSAAGVAKQTSKRISEGKFEFVMNNFAPPDMVGHTGVYEAASNWCLPLLIRLLARFTRLAKRRDMFFSSPLITVTPKK
ncbi:hypothetical protein EYC84_008892 [Monilinia fructicola]|uniref:phosphoglycerate mutase (2,3-diphosphoglycerate-independent) n=1 Tax=Monilinia fructicola TaxID=38448 RepID=A0A5M9JF19_MONFR|nr:hypothetical protein EYC84_008892 [Monilinia fructicola]